MTTDKLTQPATLTSPRGSMGEEMHESTTEPLQLHGTLSANFINGKVQEWRHSFSLKSAPKGLS